jgi:zinc protease
MVMLRRKFAVVVAAITLFLSVVPTPEANAMKIQAVKSPGGIEAWLVEEHSVPLIALRFAFEGGNGQDPVKKDGLANFLTAMMDEGAGDLNAVQFQQAMEAIAMRMGFEDSRDALYGSLETLTANRDKAVELLRLAVTKPRFDADAVERVKAQLLASIAFAEKSPDQVLAKEFSGLLFPGHPYGRPPNGSAETVATITSSDLEAYRKRTFARSNLKVVAVGDIDAKALGVVLDQVFGALPAKAELTPVPKISLPPAGQLKVIEMNVPQSVASFAVNGVGRKDPDFMAAFVLNQILGGGGFASRLMEEVREKRGLAYSVYSYLQTYHATALFAGGVATKNEEMAQSIEVIRAELKRMAEQGPTQAEWENSRSFLTGSYALRFDTNSKIANQLLGMQVDDLGIDYIDKRNGLIEAVTIADLKRVAQRILKTDNLIFMVVGKPKNLASKS